MSLLETTTFDDHGFTPSAFPCALIRARAMSLLSTSLACAPRTIVRYFKNLSRYISAAMSAMGPTGRSALSSYTLPAKAKLPGESRSDSFLLQGRVRHRMCHSVVVIWRERPFAGKSVRQWLGYWRSGGQLRESKCRTGACPDC